MGTEVNRQGVSGTNSNLKAVLIDDDQSALDALETILRDAGVSVVCKYRNGLDALAEILELDIDVVFLDIHLPGLNGLDAAKELHRTREDIYVVFVSGTEHYALNAFEVGALDYLLKPVCKKQMELTLNKLRRRKAGAESPFPGALDSRNNRDG